MPNLCPWFEKYTEFDPRVTEGESIVVWFSCGAASAVAAKITSVLYFPECSVRIVNNPVAEEDADNRRFLADVEDWIGIEIEQAKNENYPSASAQDVWEKRQFMAGPAGAPCTLELKKKARQQWDARNPTDWMILGFTADEEMRHKRFAMTETDRILPVLIDHGVTKADCYRIIQDAGLKLPRVYHMGYPNANCIGCVKATSPTYWNHVRKKHPEVFEERARQSREIGARLVRVKGERIFLDELDPEAKGQALKGMDFECGIFCEEKG